MKKFFLFASAFFALNSLAAVNLKCAYMESDIFQTGHATGAQQTKVLAKTQFTSCYDKDGNSYTITFDGVGAALKLVAGEDMVVTCPTVNKRKLLRNGSVNLGAVKVGASLFYGVSATVALNHKGGVCLLGGIDLGLGAEAVLGKMSIIVE